MSEPDYSELTDRELWIAILANLVRIQAKLDATGSFGSNDPGK